MSSLVPAGWRVGPEWADGVVRPPVRLVMCVECPARSDQPTLTGRAAGRQWAAGHADVTGHTRFVESSHQIVRASLVPAGFTQQGAP
ncbi:hypothetical protein [Streptomyces sp. TS71-3]|uniref:DUF7848 domain-containing protein n=1 Tax=Streptomyces sp. TS71-3 TaxID=2733862 RepID=UPI001B0FDCC0|nr:hypothetical protein [Streptomyces sp. TS71-3]GHJ39162.1 hypothetical protein Sm713_47710 [Streptomyces sp. TS71-3]